MSNQHPNQPNQSYPQQSYPQQNQGFQQPSHPQQGFQQHPNQPNQSYPQQSYPQQNQGFQQPSYPQQGFQQHPNQPNQSYPQHSYPQQNQGFQQPSYAQPYPNNQPSFPQQSQPQQGFPQHTAIQSAPPPLPPKDSGKSKGIFQIFKDSVQEGKNIYHQELNQIEQQGQQQLQEMQVRWYQIFKLENEAFYGEYPCRLANGNTYIEGFAYISERHLTFSGPSVKLVLPFYNIAHVDNGNMIRVTMSDNVVHYLYNFHNQTNFWKELDKRILLLRNPSAYQPPTKQEMKQERKDQRYERRAERRENRQKKKEMFDAVFEKHGILK